MPDSPDKGLSPVAIGKGGKGDFFGEDQSKEQIGQEPETVRSRRTSENSEAAYALELEDAIVENAPPYTSATVNKNGKGIQMISSAEEGSEEAKE